MTVQRRNQDLVTLLTQDFVLRREPNFAWKSACSAFQALPALRAFWPCSSVRYTAAGQAVDLSGQGHDLTNGNSADFGYYDLAPIVTFDGTNQYLSRADGGAGNWADILGTEAYITAAQRGLTFGGWFYCDSADTGNRVTLYTKGDGGAATTSYWLEKQATDFLLFQVSTGAALVSIASAATVTFDEWLFLVCRFDPGASLDLLIGEDGTITEAQLAVGVPAALQDTAIALDIGSYNAGTGLWFKGSASMLFLCAALLDDIHIYGLYHQTRGMFGV